MAAYCTLHPKVQVGAEFQDSILFGQIKKYTFDNYTSTKTIYFSIKNHIEENGVGDKNPTLNSQGELELKSLLENYDIIHFLPKNFEEKLLNNFNLQESNYTVEKYHEMIQQCEDLNSSIYGSNYFATVKIENNNIVPVLNYKKENNSFNKEREEQRKAVDLYNKIVPILERWGIKIDALTDAEERLSDGGIVDFTSIEKATDGFYHLIRLSKGIQGDEALPEEFGHVVYRALEDSPLMQRVYNLIKNNNLAGEILGINEQDYNKDYADNTHVDIVEEAVGKLIAVHFLQQIGIDDNKLYSKILGRTINNIENFFSKLNETELSNAVYEVNETINMIVKSTIAGNEEVDPNKMRIGGILKQIDAEQRKIKSLESIVKNIIENERKRRRIYKNTENVVRETSKLLNELTDKFKNEQYIDAILLYLENSNDEVKNVLKQIEGVNFKSLDTSSRSAYLRNFRNVIYSYLNIIKEVKKDLKRDFVQNSDLKDKIDSFVNESMANLGECLNIYNDNAMDLMETFWTDVLGEDLKIIQGMFKKRETHYTINDLLNMDVEDISWFDRFTDSMAHSNSYILKGMDKIVKEHDNNARLRTLEFNKKISALTKELERAGYKNQNWMFEKDSDGKRTGRYISPDSEEYKQLAPAQKKYYDEVMKMKTQLELLNPPSKQDVFRTIKIRKDLLERVKTSTNIKSAFDSFIESIKEGFLRNSTDTEYGIKPFISDFEDNDYKELPVFYTHLGKDTSEDDISMDIVSTFTAYAANVFKNDEMAGIIDTLELTRAQIRTAKNPIETQAQKRIREATGAYKRQNRNYILERMDDFFDMRIYGERKADEGTIAGSKLDTAKTIDRWIDWNSSINTAFNVLMNISNVATGNVQFKMEAIGGQFFKYKDALAADKIFGSRAKDFIADLGNRTKSSWFYIVSEAFDVMQDYDTEIGHKDFDKNRPIGRFLFIILGVL